MSVWAVVPVKPFAQAKQRLAGVLHPWQRERLSRLMLLDTLEALDRAPLAGRLVVTGDATAAALARAAGAEVLHEPSPCGLNAAVARGARAVLARGGTALLVVPGDVPGLAAAELTGLIEAHLALRRGRAAALSLVPAHDGEGTNAWLVSPPLALAPAFGPHSSARHQALAHAAGVPVQCRALPGLGLDLDHARDLARFMAEPRHAATRTARFLATARCAAAPRLAWPAARGAPDPLALQNR